MKSYLIQRWFLIVLVLALAVGILAAKSLEPLANLNGLRNGIVASVMFCMALPLAATAMWETLRRPGPPLLAVTINYGILPLVAWPVSWLLSGDLGPGLLVAASTPCTLASASVWTRRAGGNDALATLVTIITNAICFFMTPLWLFVLTGKDASNSTLSFASITGQLGLLVVLPILIAQMLRQAKVVTEFAKRRRAVFSVLSQCGILSMVFLGAIRTGLNLQNQTHTVTWWDFGLMLAIVLCLHGSMLQLGWWLGKLCGFCWEDRIAIGFAGSQKTLMVGLLMAMTLKVSILPMVAYHCLQLFFDTLVADRLHQRAEHLRSVG